MTAQLAQPLLKIGQLASSSGVPIKTIRYYEELGLLKADDRTDSQYRLFQPQTVNRLIFIKRLQSLGLTLQEIAECLAVYDHGDLPCDDIHHKLVHQVEKIDRQVAELLALRQELAQILERWQPDPIESAATICPNLPI
jgi:MerR family transcriptional regulator, copper efflux regulator